MSIDALAGVGQELTYAGKPVVLQHIGCWSTLRWLKLINDFKATLWPEGAPERIQWNFGTIVDMADRVIKGLAGEIDLDKPQVQFEQLGPLGRAFYRLFGELIGLSPDEALKGSIEEVYMVLSAQLKLEEGTQWGKMVRATIGGATSYLKTLMSLAIQHLSQTGLATNGGTTSFSNPSGESMESSIEKSSSSHSSAS